MIGVFIKVWQPPFLKCAWETERLDAMRVCATLGIPFYTCDASEVYKTEVVDYLVREYRAGRTPNPDVMCNKHVKFGAFISFAARLGADYVATGHYAQRVDTSEGPALYRGADQTKDQSYFLWTLTTEQLQRTLFPIGDTPKEAVRREAAQYGLPTAAKPDSQGVCFLGELDMKEFLSHFISAESGVVLDTAGAAVGTHEGAAFYTIGQRHGFSITAPDTARQPHYVVAKDMERNTLTVSTERSTLAAAHTSQFTLSHTNWLAEQLPQKVLVQTRYRQRPVAATLTVQQKRAVVTPQEVLELPAHGQSCVVYTGDRCLGGGIVEG